MIEPRKSQPLVLTLVCLGTSAFCKQQLHQQVGRDPLTTNDSWKPPRSSTKPTAVEFVNSFGVWTRNQSLAAALVILQAWVRGFLQRAAHRWAEIRRRRHEAATRVQAHGRGWVRRRHHRRCVAAATGIVGCWRRHQAVQTWQRQQRAILFLQGWWRYQMIQQRVRAQLVRNQQLMALVLMQARMRGTLQRKKYSVILQERREREALQRRVAELQAQLEHVQQSQTHVQRCSDEHGRQVRAATRQLEVVQAQLREAHQARVEAEQRAEATARDAHDKLTALQGQVAAAQEATEKADQRADETVREAHDQVVAFQEQLAQTQRECQQAQKRADETVRQAREQVSTLQGQLEEAQRRRKEAEERVAEFQRLKSAEAFSSEDDGDDGSGDDVTTTPPSTPPSSEASATGTVADVVVPTAGSCELMDQSGDMLDYLRNKIVHLQSQNAELQSDVDTLYQTNQRFLVAQQSSHSSFAALNDHAQQLAHTNETLQAQLNEVQENAVRCDKELQEEHARYKAERHWRKQCHKALAKVIQRAREQCDDPTLVQEMMQLVQEYETSLPHVQKRQTVESALRNHP